jgi:multidrug efflux system membrane fusion protein
MDDSTRSELQKPIGRWLSIGIITSAGLLGLIVLHRTTFYPRTDDATVIANYIGIAPRVEGPLIRLDVRDNEFVKKGELLFEIDDRPYRYALEQALSDQAALEGQIEDEARRIAALKSAVSVSEANIHSANADLIHQEATVDEARAAVTNAEEGLNRAKAEWEYSIHNLQRLEPLLVKQFVTVDQIDQARTSETAQQAAYSQAESQLRLAQAALRSAQAQYEQSQAALEESKARREQATNAVTTLEPLINERGTKEAAVETARYNLDNCRVYAPFDARVTNLKISEGAYAHVGEEIFLLIDTRRWWVIANFREGQLEHVERGMRADVYVMSKPNQRFSGIVDSIGFGVTPDADVIGSYQGELPDIQRTLNWVHLASRFPVRVLVEDPVPELFRVSESAVVIIR